MDEVSDDETELDQQDVELERKEQSENDTGIEVSGEKKAKDEDKELKEEIDNIKDVPEDVKTGAGREDEGSGVEEVSDEEEGDFEGEIGKKYSEKTF